MQEFEKYTTLDFKRDGRILTVAFNRPDNLNGFTEAMEAEFVQFLVEGALDPSFDVMILTGNGRAFSAGGDIENWMKKNIEDPGRVDTVLAKRLIFTLLDFPKPLIAKVNGHAVGLGATVALFCDVIFASDKAKIGDPHVKLGLSAGDGGAIIWPQLIGYVRAREYLMSGELVPAIKAAELGLINYALPLDELDAAVDAFAQKLADGALKAIRATKQTINLGLRQVASAVMDASIAYEVLTVHSKDHAEAVNAFLEKRDPVFTGK